MILVVVLGVLIGAIMGLTGAGGGILAVPLLVAGMHWSMQQAAPVALFAVASGAAVGAFDGFRHRLVRYKAAALMALCGIPLTRVGQQWARELPQYMLLGVFSVLMLIVSIRFYKQSQQSTQSSDEDALRLAFINAETGKFIWTPVAALVLAFWHVDGPHDGPPGCGRGLHDRALDEALHLFVSARYCGDVSFCDHLGGRRRGGECALGWGADPVL